MEQSSMEVHSILFLHAADGSRAENTEEPGFFADLNLDQVVASATAGRKEYDLVPFFHAPLKDTDSVRYRQEIFRDLEDEALLDGIRAFANHLVHVRRYLALAANLENPHHKAGWFLEAALEYCDAVAALAGALDAARLQSRGLSAFRNFIDAYSASDGHAAFLAEARRLKDELSNIRYCVQIKDLRVRVRDCASEPDYSAEVEKTFVRFQQGAVKDYRVRLRDEAGMTRVEERILNRVARLHPEVFGDLQKFFAAYRFPAEAVRVFDREIQFYAGYLENIGGLRRCGLSFCIPEVSADDKEIANQEGFDLALAANRAMENLPIVTNDFSLKGDERIFVVSGPNQGGKTTFARTFGQLHYLAALGCPVPGRRAKLFLCDAVFTHFEKEEHIRDLRGKLQDDVIRIHEILRRATPRSIIILNEIFTSTTLRDAVFLSRKIMERILELDLLCVYVTFLDELARMDGKTVSLMSTVVPENPALRTYKIVRKPADGLAYAMSIAEKYRLTRANLLERIRP